MPITVFWSAGCISTSRRFVHSQVAIAPKPTRSHVQALARTGVLAAPALSRRQRYMTVRVGRGRKTPAGWALPDRPAKVIA